MSSVIETIPPGAGETPPSAPVSVKKKKYPFIGVRLPKQLDKRVRRVARHSKKNISTVLCGLATSGLPKLESALGLNGNGRKLRKAN